MTQPVFPDDNETELLRHWLGWCERRLPPELARYIPRELLPAPTTTQIPTQPAPAKDPLERVRARGIFTSAIEALAKEIYRGWADHYGYTPWVDNGNSEKQDYARRLARERLESAA